MVAQEHRQALAQAREALRGNPDVVSVGIGYKYRAGQRTDEVCIVVGIRRKLPAAQVAPERLVPASVAGVPTDVIQYGEVKAQALTSRQRPCPLEEWVNPMSCRCPACACRVALHCNSYEGGLFL